jgi:transcriptional regulator with GAF, ATPase, and Fis domain
LKAAMDETLSSRMPIGASVGITAQVGAKPALDDLAHEEERLEKDNIVRLLRESGGVVSKSAIRLGIPRKTLNALMCKLGYPARSSDRRWPIDRHSSTAQPRC